MPYISVLMGLFLVAFAAKADFQFTTITNDGTPVATQAYVDLVSSNTIETIKTEFGTYFTPIAVPIVSNVVEDILSPKTVEWSFSSTQTVNAAIMPNWATSIVKIGYNAEDVDRQTYGYLYASGKLRNYSMVIDSYPEGVPYLAFTVDTNLLQTCTVFASPAMYWLDENKYPRMFGWILATNDIPCVITTRQPDTTTIIFSRERLNDN